MRIVFDFFEGQHVGVKLSYINSFLGNNFIHDFILSVVNSNSNDIMKANSGLTKTYLKESHRHHLKKLKALLHSPESIWPNSERIKASAQGDLELNYHVNLKALIYQQLNSESLLSIGQLYDDGCIAVLHKTFMNVFKNNNLVLIDIRNKQDELWDAPFHQNTMNFIIHRDKSKI